MSKKMRTVVFVLDWAARRTGETVSLEEDLAGSLVRAGVVRFTQEPETAHSPQPEQAAVSGPTETTVAGPSSPVDELALEGMTITELRELATGLGITPRRSKADIIAAIRAAS